MCKEELTQLVKQVKSVNYLPKGINILHNVDEFMSVLSFYAPDGSYLASAQLIHETGQAHLYGPHANPEALMVLSPLLERFGMKEATWREAASGETTRVLIL